MALGATVYVFEVSLADADRGVHETLTVRAARHPSETPEFLVTRVLAYCLEYTEGIAFSRGLSDPDEPAITVRDLTGALQSWIEIGAVVAQLDRRMTLDLAVSDRTLYLSHGEETFTGAVNERRLED
jgi:uncharacterized protein YaeQ